MTTPPPYPGPQAPHPFASPTSHTQATVALVLGILGLMSCPVLSPIAWVIGHSAERDIDARSDVVWGNRDHARIGRIVGMVGTILYGLITLIFVGIWIVALVIAAGVSTT